MDESESEYGTDGHYYTVQLVALMMGYSAQEAYALAVEAEEPDSYVKSPWDMEERYTWLDGGLQQQYHTLTGRTHGVELALTSYALLRSHNDAQSSEKYLLHRFGDCFGHIKTLETTFSWDYLPDDYANSVENMLTQYVIPKLKKVPMTQKVVVDIYSDESESIEIEKNMQFLKIFYDGTNLLSILDEEETKKELIQQLLHSYSEDVNLDFSHNRYLREELIQELNKHLPSAVQNNYEMYGNNEGFTIGHGYETEGNNPDDIGSRKNLYFYYVDKLIDLLSTKDNIIGINKNLINKQVKTIIDYATDGSSPKRLDAVLAFECEYYKNKNANEYTFKIPIKYNPDNRDNDEIALGDNQEDFEAVAKEQVDILITYLTNRLILDKITWIPNNNTSVDLDRNNYPKLDYILEVIQGNYTIETVISTNGKSIQIKIVKK
jgi:hypothetical protein